MPVAAVHPYDTPASFPVFDALATEPIQKILSYTVHWAEASYSLLLRPTLTFPYTDLVVSKRWNAITRDTPSLWSTILLHITWTHMGWREWDQKLYMFHKYARGLPLQLDFFLRNDNRPDFFRTVKKHLQSISSFERLRILSDHGWTQTFYGLTFSDTQVDSTDSSLLSRSGLMDLELVNTSNNDFKSLVTPLPLLSALRSCRQLRRLSIKDYQFISQLSSLSFDFTSVKLIQLSELRLDGVDAEMLQLVLELNMLALETLAIQCSSLSIRRTDPDSLEQYALGAGRFNSPRLPSLRNLILYHIPLERQVVILLSHTPNLRHLAVAIHGFDCRLGYLAEGAGNVDLCPALESLTVSTTWPVVEEVKAVVESRLPRMIRVTLENGTVEDAALDGDTETLEWMKEHVEVVYLPRADLQLHSVVGRMLIESAAL